MHYYLSLSLMFITSLVTAQMHHMSTHHDERFHCSGDAILRVRPDQVVLNLGVQTRHENLASAKQKNAKIISDAIAYCKAHGVPDKYIQTDQLRMNPSYKHRSLDEIEYYSVQQAICVVLDDLGLYEQILTDLIDLGINQIRHVDFRTTKLKEYRYQVREMAIEAAKEKAKFLSDQVNIQLGPIVNISEYTPQPVGAYSAFNQANMSQNVEQVDAGGIDGSSLAIGMISLKATIHLTYALKDSDK